MSKNVKIWSAIIAAFAAIVVALVSNWSSIRPNQDHNQELIEIAGNIYDSEGPVEDAYVSIVGRSEYAVTATSGNFEITLSHQKVKKITLIVSKANHVKQTIPIDIPLLGPLQIPLPKIK